MVKRHVRNQTRFVIELGVFDFHGGGLCVATLRLVGVVRGCGLQLVQMFWQTQLSWTTHPMVQSLMFEQCLVVFELAISVFDSVGILLEPCWNPTVSQPQANPKSTSQNPEASSPMARPTKKRFRNPPGTLQ